MHNENVNRMPVTRELPPDLVLAAKFALAGVLFSVALSWTGAIPGVLSAYEWTWENGYFAHHLGTLGSHFALLLLLSRPGRRAAAWVIGAGTALNALLWSITPWASDGPYFWIGAGYGAASLAVLAWRALRAAPEAQRKAMLLLGTGLFLNVAELALTSFLSLTELLHPETFDAIAYRIDGTLGFQASVIAASLAARSPALSKVIGLAYLLLPLFFTILYALHLRDNRVFPVRLLSVFVAMGISAAILYHLCPIAGPRYVFGSLFPANVPAESVVPLATTPVPPAARNGMPSMHMALALILWMNAAFLGRLARVVYATLAGLTFLATLALGQHYLVDLVAAVPLTVALQAIAATRMDGWSGIRLRAALGGAGMTLAWLACIRFAPWLFTAVPGFTWTASLATVVVGIVLYRRLARALEASVAVPQAATPAPRFEPAREAHRGETRRVASMFFVSGFAALMYQVLFSKALALTFGSTATATYTVLATYMGGMALGAWLGGRLAQKHADSLAAYAVCEAGIGVYCLATPALFSGIQALYIALAGDTPPDAGLLTALRVLLGVVVLGVPTVLMGMTLPLLARLFEPRSASLGTSVALLYGTNTAGAAVGALSTGYLVLPLLGVGKTTLLAAAANLLVAGIAFNLRKRMSVQRTPLTAVAEPEPRTRVVVSPRALGRAALLVLGIGGAVTLALEVNYVHLLAVVAGNSVYAFSLMLFAFLLGLGAGAEAARRMLRLDLNLLRALAWGELALAAVILGGVYLWEGLPDYFASFAQYPRAREFGAREVVRGFVCWVAMFPPAFLIGALYAFAMECVGRAFPAERMAALGRAAALNTVGNIVGVLAAGFLLLPTIGTLHSVRLLAATCIALGGAVLALAAERRPLAWAPAALAAALLLAGPRSFDYTALASGANVYFAPQGFGRVIDHAESVDGGLTTVAVPGTQADDARRVLLTNGKFQGSNDIRGEAAAQAGFALVPLLHNAARDRALVIGYGTGMSARTLRDAGFRELDIVELSADIMRLANAHFSGINDGVTARPGVRTYITDGRNYLLLQNRTYDVITIELSSIWFAGAASLYNREFYQLAKRRLAQDGILQQWVQLHHIRPSDIGYILGSVRAEFRHVWLYNIGGQGMIVASNASGAAPTAARMRRIAETRSLAPLLRLYGSVDNLAAGMLLAPADVDALLASFAAVAARRVSTDDNLILEYSTPKGNTLDAQASAERMMEFFRAVRRPPTTGRLTGH